MKRRNLVLIALAIGVLVLGVVQYRLTGGVPAASPSTTAAAPSAAASPLGNVVVLGWDGTRRARLKQLLADGRLPNLEKLTREGRLVDMLVTSGATATKPGWAEILTGYPPDITRVYNNRSRYDAVPEGYTVHERLKAHFGSAITTVFLSGKGQNLGIRGPHKVWPAGPRTRWYDEKMWRPDEIEGQEILLMPAEPYHLSYKHVDVFENDLGKADNVGPRVLENLHRLRDRRFFLFAEFEEPDEQGHVFGEGAPEYGEALQKDDVWLGRIRKQLADDGIADLTTIYVISDHGFGEEDNEHHKAPETFLGTNDKTVSRAEGDRKDLTPTVYRHYGLDLSSFQPPLRGQPLNP